MQPSVGKKADNSKTVVVGAVVGGLVVIVAIVVLALVASRRRRDANNLMASDLNEFQNPTFDQRCGWGGEGEGKERSGEGRR